jgi:hypothetical protein
MTDWMNIEQFMERYTTFFEEMVELEKVKLSVLMSNDVQAIQANLLEQQSNAKRIENIEIERQNFFQVHGFNELSLREVIALCDTDLKVKLEHTYERLQHAISQIKYHNRKSMEIIHMNLSIYQAAEVR